MCLHGDGENDCYKGMQEKGKMGGNGEIGGKILQVERRIKKKGLKQSKPELWWYFSFLN